MVLLFLSLVPVKGSNWMSEFCKYNSKTSESGLKTLKENRFDPNQEAD